ARRPPSRRAKVRYYMCSCLGGLAAPRLLLPPEEEDAEESGDKRGLLVEELHRDSFRRCEANVPARLALGGCGRLSLGWEVNGTAERHEACFLDSFGEGRVGGHAVGDRLDGGLRVERDDAGLDQVGGVRADDHETEQLAVARLV